MLQICIILTLAFVLIIVIGMFLLHNHYTHSSLNNNFKDVKNYLENFNTNLANPRTRGMFGEKILEDVLKHLSLKENIHYVKQPVDPNTGRRPDFLIMLPSGLKMALDS